MTPDTPDTGAGTPLTARSALPLTPLTDGEEERLRVIVDEQVANGGSIAAINAARLLATLDAARSRPATDPAGLDAAIDKAIAIGCIRQHWGAARPCDEYDDGRELCGICALRVARLSVADGPGPEERLRVEPGHNHTTTGLPTYPVCRAACPLGCDKPLAPTEQIEVRPGEFLPRPRMFVMDPIAEGEAGLAVRRAAALSVHREEPSR